MHSRGRPGPCCTPPARRVTAGHPVDNGLKLIGPKAFCTDPFTWSVGAGSASGTWAAAPSPRPGACRREEMMTKRRLIFFPGVVVLTALLGGCSSGRYDVSGTVTWQGKPVPYGLVVIEPDPQKGNTGTQTQGLIQDGHYQTLPGRGAIAGPVI